MNNSSGELVERVAKAIYEKHRKNNWAWLLTAKITYVKDGRQTTILDEKPFKAMS